MHYEQDLAAALAGAELVVLGTEWREYRDLDPAVLDGSVAGKHVIDARNALDPDRWRNAGWSYRALGRPTA
jgi:UDPglucose 6-dehydrogenase